MAFEKLYKVVTDSPYSYQAANAMAGNAEELRTQMLVEHGDREPVGLALNGYTGIDYRRLGRHDLPEIPRAVGITALFTQAFGASSISTYGMQMRWTGPGIPLVWQVAVGEYLLPVVGLSTFWAKVSARAISTSVTYLEPRVRPFYASAENGNNSGIRVNTFALDGAGDFVALDMSFAIVLYGEP